MRPDLNVRPGKQKNFENEVYPDDDLDREGHNSGRNTGVNLVFFFFWRTPPKKEKRFNT